MTERLSRDPSAHEGKETHPGWVARRWDEIRRAGSLFSESGGRLLSAAIAFYALLSIAPILFFSLKLAATLAPEESARRVTEAYLAKWLGIDPAHAVMSMLANLEAHPMSNAADVLQVILLLYASTRLFAALRRAFHEVWRIPLPKGDSFRSSFGHEVQKRLLALVMVVAVAFVIVFLLAVNAVVARIGHMLADTTGIAVWLWHVLETVLSVALFGVLVFLVMMLLPSAKVNWRDAATGSAITAVFASGGSWVVGTYLSHSSKMSMFGAASSFVFLLLWVSYSAQLLLFGVALTAVHADSKGRTIRASA